MKWGERLEFLLVYVYTKVKVKSLIRVQLFVTPWTVAHQASQSMEFSRQENWNGLPLLGLPNQIQGAQLNLNFRETMTIFSISMS